MKYLLLPFLLFAIPAPAIAETFNGQPLPANYMIWRGKLYNLDYLWGKGIAPTVQPQPTITDNPVSIATESPEVRANKQRVAFENARGLVLIERLRNKR